MSSVATRRQNHSCDQCRRSKRRCVTDGSSAKAVCRNCKHLGNTCTYDFVKNRSGAKKKPKAAVEHAPVTEVVVPASEEDVVTALPTPQDLDSTITSTDLAFESPAFNDSVDWMNIDFTGGYELDVFFDSFADVLPDFTSSEPGSMISATESGNQDSVSEVLTPTFGRASSATSSLSSLSRAIADISPHSPIALLNSTFNRELADTVLTGIHDAMITTMASRYLSYGSNDFAGEHQYDLQQERSDQNSTRLLQASPTNFTTALQTREPLSPVSDSHEPIKISIMGACRFLDNFGPLFGNILDQRSRDERKVVLASAIQVFALQSSPIPADSTANYANRNESYSRADNAPAFKTAWFNAFSHLRDWKSDSSFSYLYAVFIFHMTAMPEEAKRDSLIHSKAIGILDKALHQLKDLETLVEDYCVQLPISSLYRILLQSSLRLVKWHAYLRDTVASLGSDRKCVLEGARVGVDDSDITLPRLGNYEAESEAKLCHYSVSNLFLLYRKIIDIRDISSQKTLEAQKSLPIKMDATVEMIDRFTHVYGPWLQSCIDNFENLSAHQKMSSAFVILFWNLGVLYVVEQLKSTASAIQNQLKFNVEEKRLQYQQSATSFSGVTARLIAKLSRDDNVALLADANIKLPFVAHHANSELIASALQKAIEHTIEFNTSGDAAPASSEDFGSNLGSSADWMSSVRALLFCLISLKQTPSGHCVANMAIRELVRQYGDIVMECWTPED